MKKVALLAGILLLAGCGNEEVDVNGAKMNYEQLTAGIKSGETILEKTNADLKAKEKEMAALEKAFEDNKDEFEELEELREKRDDVTSKVKEAENQLILLESDIKTAETNLAGLEEDIIKTRNEPISVGAGFYYFGDDIPPGRYKMTANEGQRGNVFVRNDLEGKVNTILGNDEHAVKGFTFQADMGDEIEATIPILLYPVE